MSPAGAFPETEAPALPIKKDREPVTDPGESGMARFPIRSETIDVEDQRTTRAPPPPICFSTSLRVAMEVSPGVVEARAPWAAPYSTAF